MQRFLVVANLTLGGPALAAVLDELIASGDEVEFRVVAPVERAPYVAIPWEPAGVVPDDLAGLEKQLGDEATARADRLVARLREAGAHASGVIRAGDPVDAIEKELAASGPYDRIVISTLPAGASRWLKMDLPRRVERHVSVPVTTVIAERES